MNDWIEDTDEISAEELTGIIADETNADPVEMTPTDELVQWDPPWREFNSNIQWSRSVTVSSSMGIDDFDIHDNSDEALQIHRTSPEDIVAEVLDSLP